MSTSRTDPPESIIPASARTARDRIEAEHYDAIHGERYDEDRPTWREAEADERNQRWSHEIYHQGIPY